MELGYPWWLRIEHVINIFFMVFLIRSGIEIIATVMIAFQLRIGSQP